MSSLTDVDKRYLENILGMGDGFVLDYIDATFGEFFTSHKINIHGPRYSKYGTSKAKKMRAFWELESNDIVAPILVEMLGVYEANCELNGKEIEKNAFNKSKAAIVRIGGKFPDSQNIGDEDAFLNQEFKISNLHKLPIEAEVAEVVKARLDEAQLALKAGAYLAVIFMCGSVLEGVLLGAAQNQPEKFNRATSSPKESDGKVKALPYWTLAQLIDVACEVDLLKLDVKKFSHGLRDFRNYIHPYQQMLSKFSPDEHTAKVCFQVLKAALASIVRER